MFFFYLILIWPSAASAQRLRVGYYPVRDNKLALWVAQDVGIFKKYGLDVTLKQEPNGEQNVDGVISREIEIGVMGFRDAVGPIAKGADLVFVASLAANPFNFLARQDIKSPQGLKGQKVWTGRIGSGPDVSTRLVLRHLGIDPDNDVKLTICSVCHSSRGDREQVKSHPPGLADNPSVGVKWIFEGKVSASLANRGTLRDLQKEGKKVTVLADFIDSGLYITAADVLARRDWLAANRGPAKNFLKALSEATAYAKTHKDFSDAMFRKYLLPAFATGMETKFEDYVLGVLPKKPYPLTNGLEIAIQERAPNHPFFREKKASDFIDAGLMQEIDREGFFEQLYR